MTPSPEEIQKGRDALRRLGTYATRKQRVKGAFIKLGLLGLLLMFCFHKMGGGVIELLICAALGFAPILIIIFFMGLERIIDKITLHKLRKKYGSEIDRELEPKLSA